MYYTLVKLTARYFFDLWQVNASSDSSEQSATEAVAIYISVISGQ
jgi:hypothetical protein